MQYMFMIKNETRILKNEINTCLISHLKIKIFFFK